jgi:FKBP-type peptidyl-prolyl cis-trans isomerase 2
VALIAAAGGGGSDGDDDETSAAGVSSPAPQPEPNAPAGVETRVAANGDTVQAHYHGTLDSGEVFDSSRGREPLSFTVGSGQLIAGFDRAVVGLAVGESVTVRLEPAAAYGERDDRNVLTLPRAGAPEDLTIGGRVQLGNGAQATVVELTDDEVRVDANHPLAGMALTFEIKLVAIE